MRHPDTFGRFSAGDALRGLSALGVLGLHATGISMVESGPAGISGNAAMRETYGAVGLAALFGGLWLQVFFILSGYLISRPFVAAYVLDKPHPDVPRYLRNRLLRIVPAFWVAVFATLLVFGLMGSSPWSVVLTLLFLQAFAAEELFVGHIGQGWTLGTEMTFYALVPIFAVWWGSTRSRTPRARAYRVLAIAVAMFAGSFLWHELIAWGVLPSNPTWGLIFPSVAAAFAPGLAWATVEVAWPESLTSPLCRRLALPTFLLGIGLFLLIAATSSSDSYLRPATSEIAAGLIVLGALMREWSGAPAWKALKNGVTDWLGERSYSIYVLHYGIIVWLASYLTVKGHPWETIAPVGSLGLILTLILATLSWEWIEQPFLRMRKRWAKSPSRATAAQKA